MLELWLNYTDPEGATRRVRVDGSKFVIGRHTNCDLCIPDSRLSRIHATIERFGDRYEISDAGSSNGTELFGNPVVDPVPLADGYLVSLGGYQVRAELAEARVEAPVIQPTAAAAAAPAPQKIAAAPVKESGAQIPIGLIIMAPILAVVLVVIVGGVIYLVVARNAPEVTSDEDDGPSISKTDSDTPKTKKDDDLKTADTPSTTNTPSGTDKPGGTDLPTATPANLSENAKVEVNGGKFLRSIAQKSDNIFLTADQAQRVNSKVKQLSSSAVADNIKSAQKNAGELSKLANDKGLKPQFLAVAAIAKLGNTRGDVLQTAKAMSEVLDKLRKDIGNEFANDCLLMIASFDRGQAGESQKVRNMLQDLAAKSKESPRMVRTIWFLQKEGKITQGEFDRALTFLAIGTIAQNPKDFGVSIEALNI